MLAPEPGSLVLLSRHMYIPALFHLLVADLTSVTYKIFDVEGQHDNNQAAAATASASTCVAASVSMYVQTLDFRMSVVNSHSAQNRFRKPI